MDNFFFGQRVRVVRAQRARLVGLEGRIAEIVGPWRDIDDGSLRLGYGLDTSPIEWDGDRWVAFSADQLEPILPEGHRAGEEGVCTELDKILSAERAES